MSDARARRRQDKDGFLIRLQGLPFIVVVMGLAALSMWGPAAYGYAVSDYSASRSFFYAGLFFMIVVLMLGLATHNMRIRRQGRSHLISILSTFTVLPLMLAVPMAEAVPDTRFMNVYFEMVSSLTTTGMTLFPADRLPDTVHLWRAQVAWMGGFFIWVTAIAVFAPLTLGGFEMQAPQEIGQGARQAVNPADPAMRLRRYAARLAPIYLGLTAALWLALFIAGDPPAAALIHAMSVLSTSGISGSGGVSAAPSGMAGEGIIFLFFLFALTRLSFLTDERLRGWRSIPGDPEFRVGLALCLGLAILLFARHWLVSFEGAEVSGWDALRAIWGALFTVTSFLTTTGFESQSWDIARAWSGFGSPGVLLLGLAVIGGGVATTAGGVKLLRCYALAQHGIREMEKLVQPSSIGAAGHMGRAFRKQGARAAWVFFMLFALSIALVTALVALTGGLNFEEAMILSIAALSTTGPLVDAAGAAPIDLLALSDPARLILCFAMVVGRLEALALIALLNPEFWRT
ncbi:MAG: TrkH family potassium uptake protein [Paracoccaceae bacterium]